MLSRENSSPGRTGFLLIRSREAYLPNPQQHLTPGPLYQIELIAFEDSLKEVAEEEWRGKEATRPLRCCAAPGSGLPY